MSNASEQGTGYTDTREILSSPPFTNDSTVGIVRDTVDMHRTPRRRSDVSSHHEGDQVCISGLSASQFSTARLPPGGVHLRPVPLRSGGNGMLALSGCVVGHTRVRYEAVRAR